MVYLDTNCVIYFVEQVAEWAPRVVARHERFWADDDRIVVGELTTAECLVGPFLTGDEVVEASFRAFFSDPEIRVLPISASICERAARIRATHRYELIDALHLAAAAEHGCGLFLTNDARLAGCTDIPVEVLS